jgi:hypothetical protein
MTRFAARDSILRLPTGETGLKCSCSCQRLPSAHRIRVRTMIRIVFTLLLFVAVLANAILGGVALFPAFLGLAGGLDCSSYREELFIGFFSLVTAILCSCNVVALLSERAERRPVGASISNLLLLVLAVIVWLWAWPYCFPPSPEVWVLASVPIASCVVVWAKYFLRLSPVPRRAGFEDECSH